MNEYNKKVEFLKGLIETQKMVRPLFKLQPGQSMVKKDICVPLLWQNDEINNTALYF